jgi:hypothetical protein
MYYSRIQCRKIKNIWAKIDRGIADLHRIYTLRVARSLKQLNNTKVIYLHNEFCKSIASFINRLVTVCAGKPLKAAFAENYFISYVMTTNQKGINHAK